MHGADSKRGTQVYTPVGVPKSRVHVNREVWVFCFQDACLCQLCVDGRLRSNDSRRGKRDDKTVYNTFNHGVHICAQWHDAEHIVGLGLIGWYQSCPP